MYLVKLIKSIDGELHQEEGSKINFHLLWLLVNSGDSESPDFFERSSLSIIYCLGYKSRQEVTVVEDV